MLPCFSVECSFDTLGTVAGANYAYGFNTLNQPVSLTENGNTLVSGIQYGISGEMTVGPFGITRQYNAQGQLTRIGNTVAYTYAAKANDGRITKQKDLVSGEEVNDLYDSGIARLSVESSGSRVTHSTTPFFV